LSKLARISRWTAGRPGATGALLLAGLAAVRAAGSATPERAYLFGRELPWGCLFQRLYGLACPGCGMTRAVLLTLGGRFRDALAANPAGLLLVAGLALLACALLAVSVSRRARGPAAAGLLAGRVRAGARAYGLLLVAVLFAHWLAELFVG
jgi:hypothetical protein